MEEYLRHLDRELQQKEDIIREQLRLKPASTSKEQTREMSSMVDTGQKDTSSSIKDRLTLVLLKMKIKISLVNEKRCHHSSNHILFLFWGRIKVILRNGK